MRYVLTSLLLGLIIFPHYVFADDNNQLVAKVFPSKVMENTDGIVQVSSKIEGLAIDKLIATSSDSSIVSILGIEQDTAHLVSNIKIRTSGAGDVQIALAAPGFSSQEFPITVYKNSQNTVNLLMKITPNTFSTDGAKHGYVAVEVTGDDGFPAATDSDIPVTLTTSDNKIVNLKDSKITIIHGAYYAIEEFDVNNPGVAQISASSPSMQTVSSSVTVNNVNSQNTIQVYVLPRTINAFKAAYSYAVVQLHDSSGNPVIAKEDIPISVQITNSSVSVATNTSGQSPLIQANEQLAIKKGSYWGYIPLEVRAGLNGTFNVGISAKGYLVSTPAHLRSVATNALFDDKSAKLDLLPVLATGQKELVGVMHLEDDHGNVILAKDNMDIGVDSSNLDAISVLKTRVDSGSQASLVFAEVGNTVNPITLNVVTSNPQTLTPSLVSPVADSLSLVAEPLVPKILTHTTFPLAVYLTKSGIPTLFNKDMDLLVSPKEIVQIDQSHAFRDQSIFATDAILLKDGAQSVSVTTSDYSSRAAIEGLDSKPKSVLLDYPEHIIANIQNTFSIELLDEHQLPVISDKDMDIKLVSSDSSVLNAPDDVIIKKGTYYATFDVNSMKTGGMELAVLADEIPLSKFNIDVTSFTSEIAIDSPNSIDPNHSFDATLVAKYKQSALEGLKVDWKVDGAKIQNMDSITDKDGKAKISLIGDNPTTINIQATISGGSFTTTTVSKQVQINSPSLPTTQESGSDHQSNSMTLFGINPIFLIIPVAGGVAFLFLKKREMLDGISEKISIAETFSGIKDKVSELRQR